LILEVASAMSHKHNSLVSIFPKHGIHQEHITTSDTHFALNHNSGDSRNIIFHSADFSNISLNHKQNNIKMQTPKCRINLVMKEITN